MNFEVMYDNLYLQVSTGNICPFIIGLSGWYLYISNVLKISTNISNQVIKINFEISR